MQQELCIGSHVEVEVVFSKALLITTSRSTRVKWYDKVNFKIFTLSQTISLRIKDVEGRKYTEKRLSTIPKINKLCYINK